MHVKTPTTLPSAFRRIRLELAREHDHPEGDRRKGYVIIAPLTPKGAIDLDLFHEHRTECAVMRFAPDVESQEGFLRRRPGGSWSFHYDLAEAQEDDDSLFKLDQHRFTPGEYVTVAEDDAPHTYRVVSIEKL
ncbi:MAG: hypothetical protein QM759_09900 [Terricaulis sp.]